MSWLARLLRYVPERERQGISLNRRSAWWELKGVQDVPTFLRCLGKLFGENAVLYLEGTSIADDVQAFLRTRAAATTRHAAMGTIWPRPSVFHMPLTAENLAGLADLAEHHAEPEICDHLHVYQGETVWLEAHDFPNDSVSVSGEVSEDQLKAFCVALGCEYKKVTSDK